MSAWIRTENELAAFVDSLTGCRALAIDTESDSLHHHREKVCLIQVAPQGGPAQLIDPMVLRDLSPLGPVLADPAVVKILHGADYDVTTLRRDFGFAFAGLLDTMLASRFLGYMEVGLQAVLGAELGVHISKGGQKDDWSRRPLTPQQEAYALADVAHLVELGERLSRRLRERGRLAWVREECDAVAALPAAQRRYEPDAYQRIKGAGDLSPRGLAVLRDVHAWREARANETDQPPFKIVQNTTLLALAASPPRAREDLAGAPEATQLLREAAGLLDSVAHALALPDADLPRWRTTPRPVVPPAVRRRIEALKALRTREAPRLGLDPSLVLPQRLIDKLAERAPRTIEELTAIEGLRRWRIELLGAQLLAE